MAETPDQLRTRGRMRGLTTPERVERFITELGRVVRETVSVYFTGGVTAILHGWRDATIDIDLKTVPESDEVLRAIPKLKESLAINVELAAPDHFIPELPGWRERSLLIRREGSVTFFHYDLYSQALAKIERGHSQDLKDVRHILAEGLVDREILRELFVRIEPELYRYPAIDPPSFRRAVAEAIASNG
ncbi:MAG: DUF6036 family nucleotidyltransferase [Actinomycetota bacterium]